MLHRDRVQLALDRQTPDRAPKGEILIALSVLLSVEHSITLFRWWDSTT
jgi:hypothetical protein